MTRRQQLILFVLGLATVSICTVAFAMAMNLGRQMAVSASGGCVRGWREIGVAVATDVPSHRASGLRGAACVSTHAHLHSHAASDPY